MSVVRPIVRKGSLDRELFLQEDFDSDQLVVEYQKKGQLELLQKDLQTLASELETQLLNLLNSDYTDFISLSANLKGLDQTVESLLGPLAAVRRDAASVRDSLSSITQQTQDLLLRRTLLRSSRVEAQRMLTVHRLENHLEALLSDDSEDSLLQREKEQQSLTSSASAEENLQRAAELLVRCRCLADVRNQSAAAAASTLQHQLTFRLQSIEKRLLSLLRSHFTFSLRALDKGKLLSSLKIFQSLSRYSDAEELFGETFCFPFAATTFQNAANLLKEKTNRSPQQTFSESMQEILRWIKDGSCGLLLSVSIRSNAKEQKSDVLDGFDFINRSVVPAVSTTFKQYLEGPILRLGGLAKEWRALYLVVANFVREVESLYGDHFSAVRTFRTSLSLKRLLSSWNFQVYGALVQQDLAVPVENSLQLIHRIQFSRDSDSPPLSSSSSSSSSPSPLENRFLVAPFQIIWNQINGCWGSSVFLAEAADQLLKLSLQMLSRLSGWVITGLDRISQISLSSPIIETPLPSWDRWLPAEGAIVLYCDLVCLQRKMGEDLSCTFNIPSLAHRRKPKERKSRRLKKRGRKAAIVNNPQLEEAIRRVEGFVSDQLALLASANLQPVKGVVQTFRLTNKPAPTLPSFYVSNILQPLHQAFNKYQVARFLPAVNFDHLKISIISKVIKTFSSIIKELLSAMEQQAKALQMLKKASKATGMDASASTNQMTDEQKIMKQLLLDTEEFANELGKLGIDVHRVESFSDLRNSIPFKSIP